MPLCIRPECHAGWPHKCAHMNENGYCKNLGTDLCIEISPRIFTDRQIEEEYRRRRAPRS